MAKKNYGPTADFINLRRRKESVKYEDLTEEEKVVVGKFFAVREEEDSFALKMIHLESSVQLTFYLTLLIFNLYEVPLLDKNYHEIELNVASSKWVIGLIWLIITTLLSGYSTFAPILGILKKDSYRLTTYAPSITQYICVTINVLIDLAFAAIMTFLEGSFV